MKSIKIFFFIISIISFIPSLGQNLESFKLSKVNLSNHSLESIDLPIWDDFSSSNKLNNLFWSEGENVSIKDYLNVDAPSINIIEFDGLNKDGFPFNNDSGYGICDELVSDKINLSSKSLEDSVYLSFFWNFNINGEFPDYEDSLKVDFLNKKYEYISLEEITEDQPFIPILDLGAKGKKKIMVQSEKFNETNPIEEELKSFVNSIQTNKNPIVDLKSAQSALQLALDIAEQITMTQN